MLTTTILLAMPPLITETAAQTCAVPPTCSELGYTQKESDCSGLNMLKCPFDKSAVFCGGENCSYTRTSLPSGCSIADSCSKNGSTYYADTCIQCASNYTLTSSKTCSYTPPDCGEGYEWNGQICEDCEYDLLKNTNLHGVTTSGPYTNEECKEMSSQSLPAYHVCGGLRYYYCAGGGINDADTGGFPF